MSPTFLRRLPRWRCTTTNSTEAELVGVNLNDKSLQAAPAVTAPDLTIDYRVGDYRDQTGPFDFIISNQVAHHMTDEQLTTFLRHVETETRRAWLVCDLRRSDVAYRGFPLLALARLLRVHRIVREDGRLSIARPFRVDEWQAAVREAGIAAEQGRIVRRFASSVSASSGCISRRW